MSATGTSGGLISAAKSNTNDVGLPINKYKFARMDEMGPWGFIPEVAISKDGVTRIARGDGSSACSYWDPATDRWKPFLTATNLIAANVSDVAETDPDGSSDADDDGEDPSNGGVKGFAIAPSNNQRVYFEWSNGIWRSDDGMHTFTKARDNIRMNANDDFRTWGSCIAVDPRNDNVVMFGTQLDGLKITRDGGGTWTDFTPDELPYGLVVNPPIGSIKRVTGSGDGTKSASGGVCVIAYDATSPAISVQGVTCTSVAYASVYGEGLWMTKDGGQTWHACTISGLIGRQPVPIDTISRFIICSNGMIMATVCDSTIKIAGSDVWRYSGGTDGLWTKCTMPLVAGWKGLAEDPFHPGRIVAMAPGGGQKLAETLNYGASWVLPTNRTTTGAGDVLGIAAVIGTKGFFGVGNLIWDPVVKNRLFMGEGTGVWYADMPDALTVDTVIPWQAQARGIQQLVTNCILTSAGRVFAGCWDRSIMTWPGPGGGYTAIPKPNIDFGSCWSLASSPFDPNYIAASLANHQDVYKPLANGVHVENPGRSCSSTDGGLTFTPFANYPRVVSVGKHPFAFGQLAVSRPGNIVWVPAYKNRPHYTTDNGATWTPITLPGYADVDYGNINIRDHSSIHNCITADRVTPGVFYLYVSGKDSVTSGTFKSTDGGVSWIRNGPGAGYNPSAPGGYEGSDTYIYGSTFAATPGNAGHLWLCEGLQGADTAETFRRSTNGGQTWLPVLSIQSVMDFGFGKSIIPGGYPTIFAIGWVNSVYGVYRSTDTGATWKYLTTYPGNKIQEMTCITGDPDIFGRVYIGTKSGQAYGEPSHFDFG